MVVGISKFTFPFDKLEILRFVVSTFVYFFLIIILILFYFFVRTAKVWDTSDFQLKYTLEGHEQAVWAVLALDGEDDLVLTGKISFLFFYCQLKTYLRCLNRCCR